MSAHRVLRQPADSAAGGPMAGMFEFGGLRGGLGGKVVTGKPVQATFTITHTETLPGNTITNTTTGIFARGADGSTYRDVKLAAMGPWAASGKAQEFAYIRNVTAAMEYIVNVTKGTYRAFPIREHNPPGGKKDRPDRSTPSNETVTDNPNGSYTDPVTSTVYPADDKQTTRTIPAGSDWKSERDDDYLRELVFHHAGSALGSHTQRSALWDHYLSVVQHRAVACHIAVHSGPVVHSGGGRRIRKRRPPRGRQTASAASG